MICTWLNCVFCTPSRKRGVPADTIKGVLFFKISKKDPTVKLRPRKYFASSIRGIRHQLSLSLQWRRVGECRQREFLFSKFRKGSFFFQNLGKGVLFFKNWEKEVCFCKNHGQSEKIPYLPWYFFASLAWKGRGEKVYSDSVSHKRRFVFKKIWECILSIYRYKSCAF